VRIGILEAILVFCIPLTQLFSVNVGGTLFAQDAVGVILFAALLLQRGGTVRIREIRTFFLFLGIWFLGQVVTDLIRHSAPEDYIRGWSRILFFGVQVGALWLLLTRKPPLFIIYMAGLGIASMLRIYRLPPIEAAFPWKFGLGIGVVLFMAAVSSLIARDARRSGAIPAGLLLLAGFIALYEDARSIFGMAGLAAAYTYVAYWFSRRPHFARLITPPRFLLVILTGLIVAMGLISVYGTMAASGMLGANARQKYEMQSSGDLNLIQGGRVESLVSTIAIEDSPIIGHGSWAHDIRYVRLLAHKLAEAGIHNARSVNTEGENDLIPTHSHLLGAWVDAGIAGAIFWFWVIFVTLQALYFVLRLRGAPNPLIMVSAFSTLWDVPFSPFGADERFLRAAELVLLLYVVKVVGDQRPVIPRIRRRKRFAPIAAARPAAGPPSPVV